MTVPIPRNSQRSLSGVTERKGRRIVLVALALVTVASWAVTISQARTMDMSMGIVVRSMAEEGSADMGSMAMSGMTGMADQGWEIGALVTFLTAWTVMMAAMMFPAAAPMVLLYHGTSVRRRTTDAAWVPTWVFAAGYLLVWTAIGIVTWVLVQAGSDIAGRLDAGDRDRWAPVAFGAVLVGAGLYQMTPLKQVCLDHCRSPLDFMVRHWRQGRLGALRMGVVHGLYCLGCCWALFAVLVAAGVMSLAWMALLTLIVYVEKVLPIGRWAPPAIGAGFLAVGVVVLAGAAEMPWRV